MEHIDFSKLIRATDIPELVIHLTSNRPYTEEEKEIIREKHAKDPIEMLRKVQPGDLPAFKEAIFTNINIYILILAYLLLEKENVDRVKSHERGINESVNKWADDFSKKFNKSFYVLPTSVTQLALLVKGLMAVEHLQGSMEGIQISRIERLNMVNKFNLLIERLRRKHWLTDWGCMELLSEIHGDASREELDRIFKKAKIGDTNRKAFLAKRLPARAEYWIYKDIDGRCFCRRPQKKSTIEVFEKGYHSYDAAWDRVSKLNNPEENTHSEEKSKK